MIYPMILENPQQLTFFCPEDPLKCNAAHANAKTIIREEVDCGDKKFVADFQQKKDATVTFCQPLRIELRELLNLRLRQGKAIQPFP